MTIVLIKYYTTPSRVPVVHALVPNESADLAVEAIRQRGDVSRIELYRADGTMEVVKDLEPLVKRDEPQRRILINRLPASEEVAAIFEDIHGWKKREEVPVSDEWMLDKPTVGQMVKMLASVPDQDMPLAIEDADTEWKIDRIHFKIEKGVFWLYGEYGEMDASEMHVRMAAYSGVPPKP